MRLHVPNVSHPLRGEAVVPNSKYHAHRALILASLAAGTSRIRGLTDARHVQYTVRLLRGLGVDVEIVGDTFVVHGGRYRPRQDTVSAGSSGSTLYFMIGLASLAERPVTITGQKYFLRRPIGPLVQALTAMGVGLATTDGCPPVRVDARRPTGGDVHISGTLSQWISGLLLVAPFARNRTVIRVDGELNERPYLELTVAMMRRFGLRVEVADDWRRFTVEPGQTAVPTDVTLPPDIGSAAFGIAAASLHPSDILLRGMSLSSDGGLDHPEVHFLDVARQMGVPLEQESGGVRIRHDGSRLRPVTVDCRDIPDMLPVLSVMASFADGESVLRNVEHVRLKESDRVSAMLQLNALGGDLVLDGDHLRVRGVTHLEGGELSSFNDHRVLMALAVGASRGVGPSTLTYPNAYRISYPQYLEAMTDFGIPMRVRSGDTRGSRDAARPEPSTAPLPEWLRHWARERPANTALVDGREGGTAMTFAELDEHVDHAAALLLRLGVRPGERVAYQLPNRAEFVVLSLATLRIGAVCCPLMPIFAEREVGYALRRSRARVLFVPEEFRGRAHAIETAELLSSDTVAFDALEHVVVLPAGEGNAHLPAPATSTVHWYDWTRLMDESTVFPAALDRRAPTENMTAQLLFTSGTSGEPKGVLHRHDTLTRAAQMEITHLGLTGEDSVWIPSPLAHQTGFLYGMWLALVLGAPQLMQQVWDPDRALLLLDEHRGSFVQAATPFLADLVKAVERGGTAPERLRIFVATGAAVPRALAERASRVLGTAVCGAFGTTETCLGALAAPTDDPAQRWGTDGRALAGITLRVTDDEGRTLPAGAEGNFEISTPTVFEGYLDRPDDTAASFTADGWYRTGDRGIVDAAGFLRVTGRVKDVVNRGGEKVPVAEIEQLLHEHPAIEDVAVVAMPDARLGERACAFVVLADGMAVEFEEMQKYLEVHRVTKQYWPERLERLETLPRNPTGKIQKFLLRERAAALATPQDPDRAPDGSTDE